MELGTILPITYHLSPSQKGVQGVPEAIDKLIVSEGGKVVLRGTKFDPRKSHGVTFLMYNLTVGPRHGWLEVSNERNTGSRSNATYFTSAELSSSYVYYVHDDTETEIDGFDYVATSSESENFMYVGKYSIEVEMKNDNPPTRLNARIFHVVTKGEKILTNKILEYVDADLRTKPENIVYSIRDSGHSGGLYTATTPAVQITEFTQRDVNEGKVLFKHRGEESGQIGLGITDGHFFTVGILQVQASPPYVNPIPSNGSVVKFNESTVLTVGELQIETNVNANDSEIVYTVIEKPRHGVLLKNDREEVVTFTLDDLTRGEIGYKHFGTSLTKDTFKYRVSAKRTEAEGHLAVKVYPESYWEPLIVANNHTVLVEEATSVLLTRKHLEVMHPKILPSQITFLIKERPRFGYLDLQSPDSEHSDETRDDYVVNHFEQNLINDGRLYYVQSEPNQTHDSLTFEVTNGITWVRDLTLRFIVVPDKLYVLGRNLSVVEGKSVVLEESDFPVSTVYYYGKVTDYRMLEKPLHGSLVDSTKNQAVKKFSLKHLAAGVILYRHSGDESIEDSVKLVAIAGDKTSEPFTVGFNVLPVNDEIPVLINRTDLEVWQGGSTPVVRSDLAALDNDTGPSDLEYRVTEIRNGFISTKTLKKMEIRNFTQQQINNGEIIFTHTSKYEITKLKRSWTTVCDFIRPCLDLQCQT